jgi:hypothetical protein
MEPFDDLLRQWRTAHDDMMEETAELRHQLETLQGQLAEMEAPYRDEMKTIEDEIKPRAMAWGQRRTANGVDVSYRKGYDRVSYDSKRTDMVLGFLRDVLPDTAAALEAARKVSFVSPSVTIKAVE